MNLVPFDSNLFTFTVGVDFVVVVFLVVVVVGKVNDCVSVIILVVIVVDCGVGCVVVIVVGPIFRKNMEF